MLDRLAAWRHKPALWVVPLAFVVVNLLALVLFQTAFAGRVDALKRSYDRQAERLDRLRAESDRAENFVLQLESQLDAGDLLYEEYFSSEGARFLDVISQVKALAREAGMDPKRFAYPKDEVESYGLVRRGINFPVTGSYEQLRRFINLLELTDEFITLEEVQLGEVKGARGGRADPRLELRMRLSSIFIDMEYVETAFEDLEAIEEAELPPEEGALEEDDT